MLELELAEAKKRKFREETQLAYNLHMVAFYANRVDQLEQELRYTKLRKVA